MARRIGTVLGAAFCLALSSLFFSAEATTVKQMSLLEKTEACPVVVHGIVQRIESRWAVLDARIETLVTIQILESIKGDIPAGEYLTFRRGGGTIGDVTQTAPGLARYRPGEEVIMFLEPYLATYVPVGIGIGKYEVVQDGGEKVVVHNPAVATVRHDRGGPISVQPHEAMQPERLHLFMKRLRSMARGIRIPQPDDGTRPAKVKALKRLAPMTR